MSTLLPTAEAGKAVSIDQKHYWEIILTAQPEELEISTAELMVKFVTMHMKEGKIAPNSFDFSGGHK